MLFRSVEFDPLTQALPAQTAALVLPGGFPEQHLADLSANAELRAQIRELARYAPVQAECGGLAYLMDDLDGHPMCGVLAGSARFTQQLTLGYREAVALSESSLHVAGQRVVGHEFHRTAAEFVGGVQPAWAFRLPDGQPATDGAVYGGVHASYLHTHPVASPRSVARFVEHAASFTKLGR